MERQRKIKVMSVIALIVAVLGLTVAFAALSTTLTINGSATINASSWSIYFTNLQEVTTTGDAEVTTAPTLNNTSFTGLVVKLTKPGDSVTYTFDVTNAGDIDAILSSYTKNNLSCTGGADASSVCSDLEYTLTYSDGTAVAQNDTLDSNETKTLKLTLSYKDTAISLPEEAVTVSGLSITMVYGQN